MIVHKEGDQFEIIDSIMTLVSKKGKDKWTTTCSKCSLDDELFPLGSITSSVYSLNKGSCSCLCSKTPHLTEEQNKILVIRECKKRDYEFICWEGDYVGKLKTKVRVKDLITNKVVVLGSITAFLLGREHTSRCAGLNGLISQNKTKPLEYYIDLFKCIC